MGLDMYLSKRKYLGRASIELIGNKYDFYKNTGERYDDVSQIIIEVGYWRKANAIHKWFVENVQNGNDDCGEYYVPIKKLQELIELCKKVQEEPSMAEDLLPTQDGFFFGGTEYDEYYFNDIDNTIEMLSNLDDSCDYYYHSSW